jgi:hypothetical protein
MQKPAFARVGESIWRWLAASSAARRFGRWTAAHQHHNAVTAGDLGVDPFQGENLAIEPDHLTIVGAGRRGTRADIGLAFDAALEDHFLGLRIVTPEHEHVATGGTINDIGLGALIPRWCPRLLARHADEVARGARRERRGGPSLRGSRPGSCGDRGPSLQCPRRAAWVPDQHRTVAKDLRRQVNDPKAQELATAHEKLAVAIQKHLDEQVPPLAPQ